MLDVPGIRFKAIVSSYLKDCTPVYEKIKSGQLKREDLEQIIDEYNLCREESNTVQEEVIEKILSKNQKADLIKEFKDRVAQSAYKNKEEVFGLLDDIRLKIENDQAIPRYQSDALKEYLGSEPALKESLQSLLRAIGVQ